MPKDMMPFLEEKRVRYKNKDTQMTQRDLVVVKGKNSKAMVEKAAERIARETVPMSKVLKMMRSNRRNWARDIVTERTRGGLRAFRYRSGMRDLRHETKFRRVEKRLPDLKRKRHRWMQLLKPHARWAPNTKKGYTTWKK